MITCGMCIGVRAVIYNKIIYKTQGGKKYHRGRVRASKPAAPGSNLLTPGKTKNQIQ